MNWTRVFILGVLGILALLLLKVRENTQAIMDMERKIGVSK